MTCRDLIAAVASVPLVGAGLASVVGRPKRPTAVMIEVQDGAGKWHELYPLAGPPWTFHETDGGLEFELDNEATP